VPAVKSHFVFFFDFWEVLWATSAWPWTSKTRGFIGFFLAFFSTCTTSLGFRGPSGSRVRGFGLSMGWLDPTGAFCDLATVSSSPFVPSSENVVADSILRVSRSRFPFSRLVNESDIEDSFRKSQGPQIGPVTYTYHSKDSNVVLLHDSSSRIPMLFRRTIGRRRAHE